MQKSYRGRALTILFFALFIAAQAMAQEEMRPNILLILVDDMGYTDIGAYGSEIDTPNLDQLASDGLLMTNFYNQGVCRTTRAALLAGTDNHSAGGAMHQAPNQRDEPGYESYLNEQVVAFPALLQLAGYNTYFTGKWHLGNEPHQRPNARGFSRSFALLDGMASHYSDASFVSTTRISEYSVDDVTLDSLPDDFYSTTFYTDYIIESINKDSASGKPWFTYLAYTAPHWPLQAPEEYIAKYEGVYDEGYEVLREQRIESAKAAGIFPEEASSYPRLGIVPTWDSQSEEEKRTAAREMEIYAAMVDLLDENIGRLVDHLKEIDQYDNTLIMFLSDNGAEGQIRNPAGANDGGFDQSFENMGKINSFIHYRTGWASAGGALMRYFKSLSSEGGIRGPAIIHYPQSDSRGVVSNAFASVIDIAATALDLAGAPYPNYGLNGRPLHPLQGESMVPLIMGEDDSVHADDFVFAWEVFGHLAVRKGDWKLLQLAVKSSDNGQRPAEEAGTWGLYNLTTDPGETTDLSEDNPEKFSELLAAWQDYSSTYGLIVPILD